MVAWLFKCYGGCKLALLIGSHGCYRDGWWLKASKFPRKSICSRGGDPETDLPEKSLSSEPPPYILALRRWNKPLPEVTH